MNEIKIVEKIFEKIGLSYLAFFQILNYIEIEYKLNDGLLEIA